jgi:hypothetical protein
MIAEHWRHDAGSAKGRLRRKNSFALAVPVPPARERPVIMENAGDD